MARPSLPFLILTCLPLLALFGRGDDPAAALKSEATALVTTYSTTLMAALKTAMESGGPVVAIAACHEQATPIAAELAEKSGWSIKRTSLKLRNPASAPDGFEQETLALFQQRALGGEPIAGMTRSEIVTAADGRRTFRFAKAIAMGDVCATCHGTEIKPEIAAKLHELYPQDQAVGFLPGQVRGLFSLSRPL